MKLIYKKADKSVKGWGSHSAPSNDTEDVLEITNEESDKLGQGWIPTIDENLKLTLTEPIKEETEEDVFKATIKAKGVDNITAADSLEFVKIEMKKRGY